MKIALKLILGFLLFSILYSCNKKTIVGVGPIVEEQREISNITGVINNIGATVFIRDVGTNGIAIRGHQNIIDMLSISENNGILSIDVVDKSKKIDFGNLNIDVIVPPLKTLKNRGDGRIQYSSTFGNSSETIEAEVYGSGRINLANVVAKNFEVRVHGSGALIIGSGNVDYLGLYILGSGQMKGFDMQNRISSVDIEGSGVGEIYVTDTLYADINGSGVLRYKGNPVIYKNINGSGSVQQF